MTQIRDTKEKGIKGQGCKRAGHHKGRCNRAGATGHSQGAKDKGPRARVQRGKSKVQSCTDSCDHTQHCNKCVQLSAMTPLSAFRVITMLGEFVLTLLGLPKSLPVAYTVKAKMQSAT